MNSNFWLGLLLTVAGVVPALAQPATSTSRRYQPTPESVNQHPVPDWFSQAKLGIFIHWGLYSVPGWAKGTEKSLEEVMSHSEGQEWFAKTPTPSGTSTR